MFKKILLVIIANAFFTAGGWPAEKGGITTVAALPESANARVPPATGSVGRFYESAIEGVDWTSGKIRVTGAGLPPGNEPNKTIRRQAARRAALADAQRRMLKAIARIKVGPHRTLRSHLGKNMFREKISGFIQGYSITGERELESGKIEVDMELPLTGGGSLSNYLSE